MNNTTIIKEKGFYSVSRLIDTFKTFKNFRNIIGEYENKIKEMNVELNLADFERDKYKDSYFKKCDEFSMLQKRLDLFPIKCEGFTILGMACYERTMQYYDRWQIYIQHDSDSCNKNIEIIHVSTFNETDWVKMVNKIRMCKTIEDIKNLHVTEYWD